jgi:hypothetical protein
MKTGNAGQVPPRVCWSTMSRPRSERVRGWRWIAALSLIATGCAGSSDVARRLAEAQLSCHGRALRVDPIGELWLRPRAPVRLSVYDAHGCGDAQVYLCDEATPVRCVREPSALAPELASLATRALHLRRTISRARCPAREERVVQESESLWRFEACDGRWTLHCVGDRCERL